MEIFFTIVMILNLLVIVAALFGLVRNEQVARFQGRLIDAVVAAVNNDIAEQRYDWKWRWDAYNSSSYQEKLFKFWKPLKAENFYDDTSFLR